MPKFEVQVGRNARVYYKTTIEAENLEEARNMTGRHGFNSPIEQTWVADGVDEFDFVETVNISESDGGKVLAIYSSCDGWGAPDE